MTIRSKITSKAQTTIPKEVRGALGVGPGDAIEYEIDGRVVRIHKVDARDTDYLTALDRTLSEWHEDADAKAYDRL
ncbi:MAG: type II toxin-antitoxin system PrlF family antitoxin [Alphaproteobacteria bacterium]|nr:type II toxin-antitoxin system PrlF family antitoxin [Alphaproteobacteria bacterium]